uniref:Uncharacterized protein n=1 Tax=Arundo donax TaxID=35708 RepID=A0A0A9CPE0_ARUDO
MFGDSVPDNPLFAICSETTNPSGEQATMDQVHGSTELMSHPAITPFSSRTRLFTAISAATS